MLFLAYVRKPYKKASLFLAHNLRFPVFAMNAQTAPYEADTRSPLIASQGDRVLATFINYLKE